MNFQDLSNIEDYKSYLDIAFGRARKKVRDTSLKIKDKLVKKKRLEQIKVESVSDSITVAMVRIEKSFPSIESLPEFYKELCKLSFDIDEVKKSIATLKWASDQIRLLSRETSKNIKMARSESSVTKYRDAFYGRVSSVMKRIRNDLALLERVRKIMKGFPAVKENLYTVAIVGFPNVGKSTLLSSITESKVEINSYAFTTKSLLMGYMKNGNEKVQFIDTPGTLNRDDKKNMIEKQADLAMKYVADLLVYVFDPTEYYTIEKQEKLLKNVSKIGKDILLYMSKTDIADPDIIDSIAIKHPEIIRDKDLLVSAIKKNIKHRRIR